MQTVATDSLTSALEHVDAIKAESAGKRIVFFLDYDGTLTPIVSQPENAVLSNSMRQTLELLQKHSVVAILTGRDLADIQELCQLDDIFFGASHGFDIAGPNLSYQLPEAVELIPVLDQVEKLLHEQLDSVSGVKIERKRFSVATHYRNVSQDSQKHVTGTVEKLCSKFSDLKTSRGKKVIEMRPKLSWDKGRALIWLTKEITQDPQNTYSIYIGDDITDEDAFKVLGSDGCGIIVRDENRTTFAQYALESPLEVQSFLLAFTNK